MAKTVEDILEALRAIVDGATDDEGNERDLSDDEAQRYEALEVQLATARRTGEIRKRHAAYGTVATAVAPSAGPKQDDTLERAFAEWVKTGHENADVVELRAQGEGTGPAGGYLVPTTLLNRLTDRMKAFGGIETAAETITTASGETIEWPTLDDVDNTGEIVAESGSPSSGSDLEFDKRSLGAYKYMSTGAGANPVRISTELLQDANFDVESIIMSKLGQRIARAFAPHAVTGNGVGQPQGITHGCTVANGRAVEIADDTAGVVYNDLITFEHSVDPAYRQMPGVQWAFNDNTLATIKKLVDSNGDPLWLPVTNDRLGANIFNGTLLGYPVLIDQAFPDIDVDANDVLWGVFGNIREGLVVRLVSGFTVIRDPFTRKSNGEVEFVAWQRKDAIQNDRNAYVALTGEEA